MSHPGRSKSTFVLSVSLFATLAFGQQQCYFGPGAKFRAPPEVVPCTPNGVSSCCRLGDTCLAGGACWNFETGTTYMYGCTDESFSDPSCPYKCGWDPGLSPWVGLEYCFDLGGGSNTWTCQSPESCNCSWSFDYDTLILPREACKALGSMARVALYAPPTLEPYIALPTSLGGQAAYYPFTVVSGSTYYSTLPVTTYTPSVLGPMTTYQMPRNIVEIFPSLTPSLGSVQPARAYTASAPPTTSGGTGTYTIPWATTSLPSTTSASTTTITTSSSASSSLRTGSTATSTSKSTSPAATSKAAGGLSTDAKIGIGVGVAGGGLFLIAAGLFIYWLGARRRVKRDTPPYHAFDSPFADGKGEASYLSPSEDNGPFEVEEESKRISELPSTPRLAELDESLHPPAELGGEGQVYELSGEPAAGSYDVKR